MSLIQLQQQAVDEILTARTQGRRAAAHGMTLLNKNPRVLSGIRKRYERAVAKLGFDLVAARAQWTDIRDMALLEANSEEAA